MCTLRVAADVRTVGAGGVRVAAGRRLWNPVAEQVLCGCHTGRVSVGRQPDDLSHAAPGIHGHAVVSRHRGRLLADRRLQSVAPVDPQPPGLAAVELCAAVWSDSIHDGQLHGLGAQCTGQERAWGARGHGFQLRRCVTCHQSLPIRSLHAGMVGFCLFCRHGCPKRHIWRAGVQRIQIQIQTYCRTCSLTSICRLSNSLTIIPL